MIADRSDSVSWAVSRYDADDISFEENIIPVRGAFDDVHGPGLMAAIDRWEKAESVRKKLLRTEHALIQEEREEARHARSESLALLSPAARADLVQKAVARRLARMVD
jgi:hypothetical protein